MSDILPSDQKAEQALLGSCLIDPTVFFRVVIEPDDFYIVSHKEIWKAIGEILNKGNLDYITLTNYLKSKNKLDEIGGHSYITQLLTRTVTSLNAEDYARIVADKSDRRRAIIAAQNLVQRAVDDSTAFDPSAYINEALRSSRSHSRAFRTENLSAFMDFYMDKLQHPGKMSGLSSGLISVDNVTDGFEPGTLTLLSGEAGIGKSIFADQVALNIARQGRSVCIYSLEISDVMIMNRWISTISQVKTHRIKRGQVDTAEQERIAAAVADIEKLDIHIIHDPFLTTSKIRADILRKRALGIPVDFIVIDYAGLLKDEGLRGEDELDRRARCITNIRDMSSKLEPATLMVHTLNKGGFGKKEKGLEDTGGRASVIYDADVILQFYRNSEKEDLTDYKRYCILKVAKIRDQNDTIGDEIELVRMAEYPAFEEKILQTVYEKQSAVPVQYIDD